MYLTLVMVSPTDIKGNILDLVFTIDPSPILNTSFSFELTP